MSISCFTTQMPLITNYVDLDPDVKDEWGLPAMRITSTSHPDDMKCANFFHQKSIEILKAAGATKIWSNPADLNFSTRLAELTNAPVTVRRDGNEDEV